jgi:hypothetical protein
MSDKSKETTSPVLEKIAVSRRGFVKSLTIGTAFAIPMIASYSMDGLRVNVANAGFGSDTVNQGGGGLFGFIRFLIRKIFWIFHGGGKPT